MCVRVTVHYLRYILMLVRGNTFLQKKYPWLQTKFGKRYRLRSEAHDQYTAYLQAEHKMDDTVVTVSVPHLQSSHIRSTTTLGKGGGGTKDVHVSL